MGIRHLEFKIGGHRSPDTSPAFYPRDFILRLLLAEYGFRPNVASVADEVPVCDAEIHSLLAAMFGHHTLRSAPPIYTPSKYFDEAGNVLPLEYGRCAQTYIKKKGLKIRHNYLITFVMPDKEIHVIMVDVVGLDY